MNKNIRFMMVALAILALVGCGSGNQATSKEQSSFKQNYSLGLIIEAHQELLMDGPRALSGSEAGPREPFIQSQEEMVLQVNAANATPLLEAIRSDIYETLGNSGAKILGSSGNNIEPDPIAHFSYSYGEGQFYGVINIWGLQGEGNTIIILSEITESKTLNE